MGYELNKLMRQFGVSSPTLGYAGTSVPGAAPAAPAADANAAQKTAYDTSLANYNAQKTAYDADRAAYNTYKQDYLARTQNTPQYLDAQYQTTPSAAMSRATGLGGAGADALKQDIRDWFTQNPSATPTDIRAAMDKYGVSGYDVAQARGGSMWGTPLAMPTYQNYVAPVAATTQATTPVTTMYDPWSGGGVGQDSIGIDGGVGSSGNGGGGMSNSGEGGGGPGEGGWAHGGSVHALAKKYADGGAVDAADTQDQLPMPAVMTQPAPQMAAPDVPQAVGVMQPGGNQQLLSLLGRYFPQGDEYGADLKAARETVSRESQAFQDLLKKAMESKGEAGPSKSEMYFRLAAAFGAPTRTGAFVESLGKAGEATSEMLKERRAAEQASRTQNLQLGLEAQKMRMTGAKEDLATLRQLAAEGMKDKRAIATELIKDYVKSGQPQSTAGKQAQDEGLTPNTPEFQKRVSQIAEMNIDRQMAQVNATLANMSTAQANLALAQQKFGFQQTQAAKLTGPELKLKTEAEDSLASVKGAMGDLKRAFDLNKNSMGGSLVDKGARAVLEAAGSKDPTLLNTQELENILKGSMISTSAEKMKGVLSDSDLKLLAEVSGAKAKNQEERRRILINAYGALQRGLEKQQKRLNEINQGLYRETTPSGGLE